MDIMNDLIENVLKDINETHVEAEVIHQPAQVSETNISMKFGQFDIWYVDPGQIVEKLAEVVCDDQDVITFTISPDFTIENHDMLALLNKIVSACGAYMKD